jgi:predicted nucleotidyltransferase
VRDKILEQLDTIQRDHQVTIIFACESGSRAWGFPSADSDYDVRFVYAHTRDWYLSIAPARDVIELPVGPVLDVNGWDVRKALQLLRKSNISILEWLSSPIRYHCNERLFKIFSEVVPLGFKRNACARHYLSMAKSNMEKTHGDAVRMKAYLYAVRPLLCCRWVLDRDAQPPMLFRDLVSEYLGGTDAGAEISAIVEIKQSGSERDTVEKNDILNAFMAHEFDELSSRLPGDREFPDAAPFDDAFRRIITNT